MKKSLPSQQGLDGLTATLSIGALALTAALPSAVSAQSLDETVAAKPLVLSFEGGAASSDFTRELFGDDTEDKYGALGNDSGVYGSIAVSKAISNDWDWKVSATHLGFGENGATRSLGSPPIRLDLESSTFSASSLDFDIGRNWHNGQTEGRFGIGITGAQINKSADKGLFATGGSGYFIASTFATEFAGIGPKFSANISHRLKADSPMRLIAGASIANLNGTFSDDKGLTAFLPIGDDDDDDDDDFAASFSETNDGDLMIASAYLGMAYDFSDRGAVRFGLRADEFTPQRSVDFDLGQVFSDRILTTTAFVGVDIRF